MMEIGCTKRGYELGRRDGHAYMWRACENCGRERWVKITHNAQYPKICRVCSSRLPRHYPTGADHPRWKGEILSNGYVYIHKSGHPSSQKSGYIKRARLVLEEKLGRLLLPEESSHHLNGIKDDDRPENLEAKSNGDHIKGHAVNRARNKRGQFIC